LNVPSQVATNSDDRLGVLWDDGERVFCRERRLNAAGDLTNVLTISLSPEHPTVAGLDRLIHEYTLKDELDGPWAVRPLELIRERGQTILVLEDTASEPLKQLLGAPMEAARFLRLAIAIAESLTQLHRNGLVHKDLKPANILVSAAQDEVRFTGVGIASPLHENGRHSNRPRPSLVRSPIWRPNKQDA
jgi:serine/threonine protein kinase